MAPGFENRTANQQKQQHRGKAVAMISSDKEKPINRVKEPLLCIRVGCTRQAVANINWNNEYCSNACVVLYCRNVFEAFVEISQHP